MSDKILAFVAVVFVIAGIIAGGIAYAEHQRRTLQTQRAEAVVGFFARMELSHPEGSEQRKAIGQLRSVVVRLLNGQPAAVPEKVEATPEETK